MKTGVLGNGTDKSRIKLPAESVVKALLDHGFVKAASLKSFTDVTGQFGLSWINKNSIICIGVNFCF